MKKVLIIVAIMIIAGIGIYFGVNKIGGSGENSLEKKVADVLLSSSEEKYLKGENVRHLNSSENLTLNLNFRKEDLINSISEGVNINFYKKTIEDEIKHFRINNVIQNRSRKLNKFLKEWVNSGDLTENRAKEIQDLYKNMNAISKSQFNKDLEKKMSMVESVVRNPRSGYDVYHALKEIALIQDNRDFIVN